MIDFNNAGAQRPEQIGAAEISTADPVTSFLAKMSEYDLNPSVIAMDEGLHRFDVERKGDKAGWYVFYPGDIAAGSFGNWKTDLKENWCSKSVQNLTWDQRQAYTEKQQKAKAVRKCQEKENQASAKVKANKIWQESAIIDGQGHQYLKDKGIQPHHGRLSKDGDLVVPQIDEHGEIWALQFIKPDGKKKFQPLGRRDGVYFEILGGDHIYLCEGYSTGASIHEATGATVICAFNSGSLPKVAKVIKGKYHNRSFSIAADNDQFKAKNVGIEKANEAAKILHGAPVVFPSFSDLREKPTDFNDLAKLEGLNAVTIQLGQIGKKIVFPPLSQEATKLKGRVQQRPKPKEFLWNCWGNGFLPKGVVGVIAATGGTGKTFVLLALGLMTAAGKAFGPIESIKPCKTLIICGEDDQEEVERRLWDVSNGDFPDLLHAASVYGSVGPLMELEGNKPIRATGFHWLEETIQKHPGMELLIFDPKSRFYGLDENNNDHATQWIQSLEYLSKEYNLTILFSAHTSDANSGQISQKMNRGASALVDGCRWQAGLVRLDQKTADHYGIENPRGYIALDTPKNNYAADAGKPLYFRRGENGQLEYCNLKEDGDKAKCEKILELVAADPTFYTRYELLRDKDFFTDMKDVFKKIKKDEMKPLVDRLIDEKKLVEEAVKTDGRTRNIISVNG
jgi:putative DNA primase/helicase